MGLTTENAFKRRPVPVEAGHRGPGTERRPSGEIPIGLLLELRRIGQERERLAAQEEGLRAGFLHAQGVAAATFDLVAGRWEAAEEAREATD